MCFSSLKKITINKSPKKVLEYVSPYLNWVYPKSNTSQSIHSVLNPLRTSCTLKKTHRILDQISVPPLIRNIIKKTFYKMRYNLIKLWSHLEHLDHLQINSVFLISWSTEAQCETSVIFAAILMCLLEICTLLNILF